ncbi:hypothetical protein QSV08_09755 [Maribacter sp. BPC-D8]|uniref:hypothetical protein n=1 Tax=Maribacter sp. BPC-D8 TaxID=3053613 RepID=UPI002B48842D|nr:hypothetical protein [Maribacter sp. BPC-D8]WRI31520.1 hypothetical protein QSV08_09755 [Maribacter sp. BPC-D8]
MKLTVNTLLLLLLSFSSQFSCSQENTIKNDLITNNIKGKVWKIRETVISQRNEELFADDTGKKLHEEKLKEPLFFREYEKQSYTEYNTYGDIVDFAETTSNWKKKVTNHTISLEYNNTNQKTKKTIYNDGKILVVYEYDKGNEVRLVQYDTLGKSIGVHTFDHSIPDSITSFIRGAQKITRKVKLKNGHSIKDIYIDSLGQITFSRAYVRNHLNDYTSFINRIGRNTYKSTYTYVYDKRNNWIKRNEFDEKGKIKNVVIRNIVYYDDPILYSTVDDFVGDWFVIHTKYFMRLSADKTYQYGYFWFGNPRVSESGTWNADFDTKQLTLTAENPKNSKQYKFEFENSQMALFTMDGKNHSILLKVFNY